MGNIITLENELTKSIMVFYMQNINNRALFKLGLGIKLMAIFTQATV
jgi:hypothetical protein